MKGSVKALATGLVLAFFHQCQGLTIMELEAMSPSSLETGYSPSDDVDSTSIGLDKHLRSAKRGIPWGKGTGDFHEDGERVNHVRIRLLEDEGKRTKMDPAPTSSPYPSESPAPSISIMPSDQPSPTPSTSPSASMKPSQQPTISTRPSISASPVTDCDTFPRDEYLMLCLATVTDVGLLLTNTTSQGMAFEYLLTDTSDDVCNCDIMQKYALATLYFATQGNDWIKNDGWLVEPNECDWFQVQCNNNNSDVFRLTLGNNELNGTLPEEVKLLATMEVLDVSQNYLSGTIPQGLEELGVNLKALRLARNNFDGLIPASLANMTSLLELVLSDNLFSGTLPSLLFQMSNLERLHVDTNLIGGIFPTEIVMPALLVLHASHNQLSGPIPDALWNMSSLSSVQLRDNALTGVLSEGIGRLTALTNLDLSDNQLEGSIPILLGRLSTLALLDLSDNNFNGTLRDVFSSFAALEEIDVSSNSLSGLVPGGLFDLVSMKNIAMHNNLFEGRIPDNWQNAASLSSLSLYNNRLTGAVPPIATGSLQSLVSLILHGNQLTGSMPPSVCELRFDTFGVLDFLWADCGTTANPRIDCNNLECCTICFPTEQRMYEAEAGF